MGTVVWDGLCLHLVVLSFLPCWLEIQVFSNLSIWRTSPSRKMPWGILWSVNASSWSRIQRGTKTWYTYDDSLGLFACFGILWFTADLRSHTGGKAFPQMSFDHWEPMSGSPHDAGTKCNETVCAVRKRKGLKEGVPELSQYLDKL